MVTLRPDQIDDVVWARDALRRNRQVLLCRPTGTGKTVWVCAISEVVQAGGARTLILQHREELIAQTSRTPAAMAHGIIAAGHPTHGAPVQIASINVALFIEGLDAPLLGWRPTQSLALHLQTLGRTLRTAPGKRRGLILDHAGNSLRHGLYGFEHAWSLRGRTRKSAEPRAGQCPECGAVLPIPVETCPECGYRFVVQLQPPRIPVTAAVEPEGIYDEITNQQLRVIPYRQLLEWCRDDPLRLRRARLVRRKPDGNRYARGWEWHTASAGRAAQRPARGEG